MADAQRNIHEGTILEIFELYRLLGEFGQIERVVFLPNGRPESDSHHSFALALVAFDLASKYAPELDTKKILLYSLVHDLTELITGDMPTLMATREELAAKAKRDQLALKKICEQLAGYPHIVEALKNYEEKADDEAHFVYWIDKMITIPTHFFDSGANLRAFGIKQQKDIQDWYERTLEKLHANGKTPPTWCSSKSTGTSLPKNA